MESMTENPSPLADKAGEAGGKGPLANVKLESQTKERKTTMIDQHREQMKEILKEAAKLATDVDDWVEACRQKEFPPEALKALGDDLKRKMADLDLRKNRLEALATGHAIAFRQRTGREPEVGDQITEADVKHGERLAAGLLAATPEGTKH
jgi:hypothetical protein